jgi:hypothetical protein
MACDPFASFFCLEIHVQAIGRRWTGKRADTFLPRASKDEAD